MRILETLDYFIEYEGHNILNSIKTVNSKYELKNSSLTDVEAIKKVIIEQKYQKVCRILMLALKGLSGAKNQEAKRLIKNLVSSEYVEISEDTMKQVQDIFSKLYSYEQEFIKKQKQEVLGVILQTDFLLMYPVYNFGSSLIPLCTYRCTFQDNEVAIEDYAITEELISATIGYDNDVDSYFGSKNDKEEFFQSINSYSNKDILELAELTLEEIYNKIPDSRQILELKRQKHFSVALDGSITGYVAPFKEELMLVKYNLKTSESALLSKYLINETSHEYMNSMSRTSHYGSYPFEIDYLKEELPKYGVNEKQWSILDRSEKCNMLAVTGPPGTGKTTVLKEVIADNLVKKTRDIIDKWDEEWVKLKSGVYQSPLGGKNKYSIIISSTNNNAVDNLGDEFAKEIALFNHSPLKALRSTFCAKMGKYNNVETFINDCFLPLKQGLNGIEEYEEDLALNEEFIKIYGEIEEFNKKIALFDSAKEELKKLDIEVFQYEQVNKLQSDLEEKCNKIEKDINESRTHVDTLKSKVNEDHREIIKDKKRIGTLNHELEAIEQEQESINRIKSIPLIGKIYVLFNGKKIRELDKRFKNRQQEVKDYEESILFLTSEITKNESTVNVHEQQIVELDDSFRTHHQVIKVMMEYLLRYGEFQNILNNYNIDHDVHESRFKICNCTVLRMKRSRLFKLSLLIQEAYILKNKKQILEDMNKIYDSCKSVLFSRYYRSTFTYNKNAERDLRALWEVFCMCFPVITTTLHSLERGKFHMIKNLFDLLLIDEAGQVMPHYLIGPLFRAKRTIIVGDVLQLKPVRNKLYPKVFEKYANKYNIEDIHNLDIYSAQSFANMSTDYYELLDKQKIGILLEEHRRCEKNIAMFSNDYVYDNRMKIVKANEEKEFLGNNLTFIDVKGLKNSNYTNMAEVNSCKAVVSELQKVHPNSEIGIITPYKNQKNLLKEHINGGNTECGTVHTFQGKGKDIIIISLVVSSIRDQKGLSFLGADPNFLNVALTRAKKQLIIIGNYDILDGSYYLSRLKEALHKYGSPYSFYHNGLEMKGKVYEQMKSIMSYGLIKNEEYNRIFGEFEAVRGLLSNDQHYKLLNSLFETAESVEICSPWITRVVAKDPFIDKIKVHIEEGKKYKVIFGNKKTSHTLSSREEIRSIVKKDSRFANKDEKIEDEVEMLLSMKRVLGEDLVYKPPMHIKILVVNNRYMVIGSHNWLCKNGTGHNSPDELSCIVEDESMLAYVRNEIM